MTTPTEFHEHLPPHAIVHRPERRAALRTALLVASIVATAVIARVTLSRSAGVAGPPVAAATAASDGFAP